MRAFASFSVSARQPESGVASVSPQLHVFGEACFEQSFLFLANDCLNSTVLRAPLPVKWTDSRCCGQFEVLMLHSEGACLNLPGYASH